MPSRKIPFVNGEYYHIYNRGVAKLPITSDSHDFKRFVKSMQYYQFAGPKPRYSFFDPKKMNIENLKNIVTILCFCIMPNHFHFLLKQEADGGITEFVSKLSNSYTKYFNMRSERVGPLFQGEFKAVRIESDEQFIHLSRYIHLNPVTSYLVTNILDYFWSSYSDYVSIRRFNFVNTTEIMKLFKTKKEYEKFVLDQEEYAITLDQIKIITFEAES